MMPARKIRKDATVKPVTKKYGVPAPRSVSGKKIRSDATLGTVRKKLSK
jgi:hypothetical protein